MGKKHKRDSAEREVKRVRSGGRAGKTGKFRRKSEKSEGRQSKANNKQQKSFHAFPWKKSRHCAITARFENPL